jgi:hypothetical protein
LVPSDFTVSCLATLMWNESHEDKILGMQVCGLIVRNRVLAGWENGQWLTLIANHDKYHFPKEATTRVMKLGDPHHDSTFRRCLAIAENIYNGRERDITADHEGNGALWYCRLNECSDEFKEKIVRQMQVHPMISTIGRISCFR